MSSPRARGLHHAVHQRALLKSIYRHKLYSLRFARLRVREISSRTTLNLTLRHALWPRVRASHRRATDLTVGGTYERRHQLPRPAPQPILHVTGERCLVRVDFDNRDPSAKGLEGQRSRGLHEARGTDGEEEVTVAGCHKGLFKCLLWEHLPEPDDVRTQESPAVRTGWRYFGVVRPRLHDNAFA